MYYVYIIYSKILKRKYIGFSSDLKKRMIYHNSGKSTFTRRGMPWNLIYYAAFVSKKDACREELFLKTGKGRERLAQLLDDTITMERWLIRPRRTRLGRGGGEKD